MFADDVFTFFVVIFLFLSRSLPSYEAALRIAPVCLSVCSSVCLLPSRNSRMKSSREPKIDTRLHMSVMSHVTGEPNFFYIKIVTIHKSQGRIMLIRDMLLLRNGRLCMRFTLSDEHHKAEYQRSRSSNLRKSLSQEQNVLYTMKRKLVMQSSLFILVVGLVLNARITVGPYSLPINCTVRDQVTRSTSLTYQVHKGHS